MSLTPAVRACLLIGGSYEKPILTTARGEERAAMDLMSKIDRCKDCDATRGGSNHSKGRRQKQESHKVAFRAAGNWPPIHQSLMLLFSSSLVVLARSRMGARRIGPLEVLDDRMMGWMMGQHWITGALSRRVDVSSPSGARLPARGLRVPA
jgi:hypothetical protein